jgi:NAD-dependent deacetylase
VVLFGEMLPEGVLERAEHAASRANLFFVIGTSAVVYPAASLPIVAKNSGAKVIEVNPERTDITMFANVTVLGKAAEVLPQFLREAG